MQTDIQSITKKTGQLSSVRSAINQTRHTFDLPALITDFCSWYGARIADNNRQWDTKISLDIPQYSMGNKALMKYLLFETGKNSLHYSGNGTVSVEVGAEQHNSRRFSLSFCIALASASIPHIRGKEFFQSASANSEQNNFQIRSTNLYYARMIAQHLGGDIRISDTTGCGIRYLVEVNIFTPPS